MNLSVKRFNFSSGVSSCAAPSMIPAAQGDYCRYSEACAVIEEALKELEAKHFNSVKPRILCMNKIPLDDKGRSNTYCMLDIGHEGKCK